MIKLIESDNIIIMQKFLKRGLTFDLIYLDPPYFNKSQKVIYRDKELDHDKWHKNIKTVVQLSRGLLKVAGVVAVSIDDARLDIILQLLIDTFGRSNHISTIVVHRSSGQNNAKLVSPCHEYLLLYANNIAKLPSWHESKPGSQDVIDLVEDGRLNGELPAQIEKTVRNYYKAHPKLKGIKNYRFVDDHYRVYRHLPMKWPNGGGPRYDIIHPITHKPCKIPDTGWSCNHKTMEGLIKEGKIWFGKTHNTFIQKMCYLDERMHECVKSVWNINQSGTKELNNELGKNPHGKDVFTYAKPPALMEKLIRITTSRKGVILDPYAGSGTTGLIAKQLDRSCILIECGSIQGSIIKERLDMPYAWSINVNINR